MDVCDFGVHVDVDVGRLMVELGHARAIMDSVVMLVRRGVG